MKALFTVSYGRERMQSISGLGFEVDFIKEKSINPGMSLKGYDCMVCYDPFDKLDYTDVDLKWVHLVSRGVNHVPDVLKSNPDIVFTNNVDGTAPAIGECIVYYLLSIFKKSKSFYDKQRRKVWEPDYDILEITGKTIGFLGTGHIAYEAAKRLKAFDAGIIGLNTSGHPADGFDEVYPISGLYDLLERSDAVICVLPATDKTRHLLDSEAFSHMKDQASLINISRGSVIDEKALCDCLGKGRFRGVALDVFEQEPLSHESPLWDDPRVIITPHNAYLSDYFRPRIFSAIYSNARKFINGEKLDNIVDFSKGY